MFNAKNAHERFCYMYGVCRSRLIVCSVARSPHHRGKLQRFPNFERWEVDVILGAVYDITTVPFLDFFGGERVVENISLNIIVISAMVGEHFEKGTASGTWATQNNCFKFTRVSQGENGNRGIRTEHIAWKYDALEVGNDIA